MNRNVLVLNTGSSSIKFQLLAPETGVVTASGIIEQIGEPAGAAAISTGLGKRELQQPIADHGVGLSVVLELLKSVDVSLDDVFAVGHRVVHGGPKFSAPVLLTPEVVAQIAALSPLAPLHNPAAVQGIEAALAVLPKVPQVAVFDTAFFQTLPAAAYTYALNQEVAAEQQIRRYGFHGTSHAYVSEQVANMLGRDLSELKQIVLHLGNGASISAIDGGKAVETSMGLTPLEGLVMGTRSGDIDPGVIFHLARQAGMSIDEIDTLLNKKSGLIGLCGDNDFRVLLKRREAGDPEAALAYAVYVHRLKKYIGSYAAVLGSVDAITFTAGVGENTAALRSDVLAGMPMFGISVDAELNALPNSAGSRVISAADSRVAVLVVPTNEELSIARQTLALL